MAHTTGRGGIMNKYCARHPQVRGVRCVICVYERMIAPKGRYGQAQAKLKRAPTYKVPWPCDNGHTCFRWTETGECLYCLRQDSPWLAAFSRLPESLQRISVPVGYYVPREIAKAWGFQLYWPRGKRCSGGHLAPHDTESDECLSCVLSSNAFS